MGTLLDYLGGVDTPLCRVPVPNNRGKLSKYLGEGWSISQLLLGPHTPNTFWRFLGHIEIFLDYCERCSDTCGQSVGAQKQGQVEQIHGKWGGQYFSFY